MSELTNTDAGRSLRRSLLVTVSLAALSSLSHVPTALAEESDRPTVWLEFGGQLDRLDEQVTPYVPAFALVGEQHGLFPLSDIEIPSHYAVGEQASVSFQPTGSEWKFSASIQYGRSNTKKYRHQQTPYSIQITPNLIQYVSGPNIVGFISKTADYASKASESHTIVDFQVGKDVGLGLWKDNVGNLAFGMRFAQFSTNDQLNLRADPNPHRGGPKYFPTLHHTVFFNGYYQFYKASPELNRSFRGWGPSLSWSRSLPIVGSDDQGAELTIDWGANLAVLFGRQKVLVQHQTTGDRHGKRPLESPVYTVDHYVHSSRTTRSKFVTLPNVGGLAGMSLKFPNAKVSLGYRADFFFGALDGGVDVRRTENVGFHGPYASLSIGLGG